VKRPEGMEKIALEIAGVVPLSAWRGDDEDEDYESTAKLDVSAMRAHAASTKRGAE